MSNKRRSHIKRAKVLRRYSGSDMSILSRIGGTRQSGGKVAKVYRTAQAMRGYYQD